MYHKASILRIANACIPYHNPRNLLCTTIIYYSSCDIEYTLRLLFGAEDLTFIIYIHSHIKTAYFTPKHTNAGKIVCIVFIDCMMRIIYHKTIHSTHAQKLNQSSDAGSH